MVFFKDLSWDCFCLIFPISDLAARRVHMKAADNPEQRGVTDIKANLPGGSLEQGGCQQEASQ